MKKTENNDFSFVIEKRVRYSETDSEGILNNISIFKYFEAGRTEFWRAAGVEVPRLQENGIGFVMVRQECDYRAPVYPDELLDVLVRPGGVGNTSFTTEYRVRRKATGETVAEGKTVHVVLDKKTGKPKTVPGFLREEMENYGTKRTTDEHR